MKFAEKVNSFLKSLGNGEPDEDEKKADDDDLDLDNQEEGEGDEDEVMEKAELTDATEILSALVNELKTVNKSIAYLSSRQDGIEKAQADVGEAIVGVAELVSKIANTPLPLKTTLMVKGGLGSVSTQLDKPEFEKAQKALINMRKADEITVFEATRLESEMQKAMQIMGYQMKPEDRALIAKAMKTA